MSDNHNSLPEKRLSFITRLTQCEFALWWCGEKWSRRPVLRFRSTPGKKLHVPSENQGIECATI